jgi:hypothetical protein
MAVGEATLTVRVPISINEIFADVPADTMATSEIEGDANRDGMRSADDDEFIELVNSSNEAIDLSGVLIADATSTRFTFPTNTIIPAGSAALIFGGGAPLADAGVFGGALVYTANSLSLNDGGDTVSVLLPIGSADVMIGTQSYGTGESAPTAPRDQSLVRAPDAASTSTGGAFIPHTSATNAEGRAFSPGTRVDGTPFGSPLISRIEVIPAAATIDVGESQTFAARAFGTATDGTEIEVPNVSFVWDATNDAVVSPRTGNQTRIISARAGTAVVHARAGGRTGMASLIVNAVVARIELTPETSNISIG